MPSPKRYTLFATLSALLILTACGPATLPGPGAIDDPYEAQNRQMHAFNRSLDRSLVRPGSNVVGESLPGPVLVGVGRMSSNLSQPSYVVNNILQLRLGRALHNTARFVINSTIGVAGIFDPATSMGLEGHPTDFGETLHVWGTPEGAYTELPFLGPSTSRHAVGRVVDIALDPINTLHPRPANIARGVHVVSGLGNRHSNTGFIDSILYESEDSYAQTRSIYLQNRRFQLRNGTASNVIDPDEDSDGDLLFDPYED
ncbi:VacJ family lipoprotein [Rhodophyticola sp. CCM32]|nr:VacJ family lipoprotein [Rhodophyticola sp. CCM32]